MEKFNNYLIMYYPKSKLTNVYKRVIKKISHNRYTLETYYRVNKIDKCFKSDYVFNETQIQMLICLFIHMNI